MASIEAKRAASYIRYWWNNKYFDLELYLDHLINKTPVFVMDPPKTVRQVAVEENELPEISKEGPAVEGLEIPVITKIEPKSE